VGWCENPHLRKASTPTQTPTRPPASHPDYTLCESLGWLVWDWLTGLAPAAWP